VLEGKHILLGVTGGIAAYKTPLLVRELIKQGAVVQVVMTHAAAEFITPLTLGTLSRRPVIMDIFPRAAERRPDQWTKHIDLALWADVMLIAPASANTLAKIAAGMADNFLTALVLALRCPLAVAPSMDVDMYRNPATQDNLARLRSRGCHVLEPDSGELASGLSGPGRLPEPQALTAFLEHVLKPTPLDLTERTVLVTAGPTHEPIDPVRYIGNRSSGRMGFALAAAAAERGASVVLIAGPVALETPAGVRRINVMTAHEMEETVMREFDRAHVLIMAAAVADFSPRIPFDSKIKRQSIQGDLFTLELKKNPDILARAGSLKNRRLLVGFALETDDVIENARQKLASKHCDIIVLNNPREKGAGFGTDTNVVTLLSTDGKVDELPLMPKIDVAHAILDRVARLLVA
jgi:phosphopantothenoylcysteine decarboxylase/phosphopantothenate--cysteine ligase